MTDLILRKLNFRFDDATPFNWLPSNPSFAMFANAISVLAPAFEKFIVASTRKALPQITDPAAAQEADAFLRQEAQHARHHLRHIKALTNQYPGLQEVLEQAFERFNVLLTSEPLEFHLAYTASLEATFPPFFNVLLNNEKDLFRPGHDAVASLFLWHFVEELEHRSSAFVVYNAVVPDPKYRSSVADRVLKHVTATLEQVLQGFERHVPASARGASYQDVALNGIWRRELSGRLSLRRAHPKAGQNPSIFASVPLFDLAAMGARLARTRSWRHDPAKETIPAFATHWFDLYQRGADVTQFYAEERRFAQV